MTQKRIETGKSPEVVITCRGDLMIRGWAETAVLLKGDAFEVSEGEKIITIEASGDLSLMVPFATKLSEVSGYRDMELRNVSGDVAIATAMSDLAIQNLGNVEINQVNGDLSVRNLNGVIKGQEFMADVSIRNVDGLALDIVYGDFAGRNVNGEALLNTVMGDISLRTVTSDVTIGKGHRDVNLRNLGGINRVEMTHGDIRLRGGLAPGKHFFKANGDIVVRWPLDTPLNVEATAPNIKSRLKLDDITEDGNLLTGHIGDGETFVILEAQGSIILKEFETPKDSWDTGGSFDYDFVADLEGLGEQINAEISSRMSQLSTQLEQNFGPEFSAKLEKKAQEAAVKAEQAAERAVRQAEKAAKKAGWQVRGAAYDPPVRTSTEKSARDKKATEEEQVKILKMVEKGIISPEEANTLLEAIGG